MMSALLAHQDKKINTVKAPLIKCNQDALAKKFEMARNHQSSHNGSVHSSHDFQLQECEWKLEVVFETW
jgi:hypothetical protein